ncbi:type I pantothenate kinase [Hyphomicrobium sp.]|uniref:type I pantothenate kinase n=1 Tax=Hyphomicrobium sp. TaxID=82 RepID=UPI000F9008F2|nr:type I pantothenate kinase [Hyphomicrobium sp.]RUP08567.1 MAG: type I pantothenate kinase [Hyphomicrobium sp.]
MTQAQGEAHRPESVPFSPYRVFTREEWARLRADTPMTLKSNELEQLSGIIEELSVDEVEQIYLPLSRLLNLYVAAAQKLHSVSSEFLGRKDTKVPFIIGVAGSVAVGKSTTARVLRALLARWPDHPRVDLMTTDGFLFPNAELQRRGLMERKGFPDSFDTERLLRFLGDVKSGVSRVSAPVYSHFQYDILAGQEVYVEQPDILIIEGLNILQPAEMPKDGGTIPFVSDFIDFSIYIDADPAVIEKWYLTRFMRLRSTAFRDPGAYFHKYATLAPDEVRRIALKLWREINLKNLEENILPTRRRAQLILQKGESHRVEVASLRKL